MFFGNTVSKKSLIFCLFAKKDFLERWWIRSKRSLIGPKNRKKNTNWHQNLSQKSSKTPIFVVRKWSPQEVVLFLTLEVVLFLALERLKRGTKTNSPAYIYIYISLSLSLSLWFSLSLSLSLVSGSLSLSLSLSLSGSLALSIWFSRSLYLVLSLSLSLYLSFFFFPSVYLSLSVRHALISAPPNWNPPPPSADYSYFLCLKHRFGKNA